MNIEKIPDGNWAGFLESFSRQHKDWLVTVKKENKDIGEKLLSQNVKLKELAINIEEGEFNNTTFLVVEGEEGEINYMVDRVRKINFEKENGKHLALSLISDLGDTYIVQFQNPSRPEIVDGIT